jgi:hypothetical protein
MDSKLILAAARGTLDGSLTFPVAVSKPIETGFHSGKSVRPDSQDIHL